MARGTFATQQQQLAEVLAGDAESVSLERRSIELAVTDRRRRSLLDLLGLAGGGGGLRR
jgi:hypothetical protein